MLQQLFFTPKSHFARKVRILALAWEVKLDYIDIGNVGQNSKICFGNNPLMKVPTLVDGKKVVFDSDHIAQYMTSKYDPTDVYQVLTRDTELMNLRCIMNGIMAAEVEILLARRSGIATHGLARYDKLLSSMETGLQWLEDHIALFPDERSYACFHLVCMWDHIALYDVVSLKPYPKLAALVARVSLFPFVRNTAPPP